MTGTCFHAQIIKIFWTDSCMCTCMHVPIFRKVLDDMFGDIMHMSERSLSKLLQTRILQHVYSSHPRKHTFNQQSLLKQSINTHYQGITEKIAPSTWSWFHWSSHHESCLLLACGHDWVPLSLHRQVHTWEQAWVGCTYIHMHLHTCVHKCMHGCMHASINPSTEQPMHPHTHDSRISTFPSFAVKHTSKVKSLWHKRSQACM